MEIVYTGKQESNADINSCYDCDNCNCAPVA